MIKLKKIKLINHPLFENLDLNFYNTKNEKIFDTIIIAGENGVGKSILLSILYYYVLGNPICEVYVEVEENNQIYEHTYTLDAIDGKFSFYEQHSDDQYKTTRKPVSNKYEAIYSDVDINFFTDSIISNSDMKYNNKSHRSNQNTPNEINQLFIDIQLQDYIEFSKLYKQTQKNGKDTNNLNTNMRMERFTSAFENMFSGLRYDRVDDQNGERTIIFKKNNIDISIAELSSGEKQIIYRGGFLLKDVNALNNAFVFIDEPEISLHPKWQKKILDFYRGIFTNTTGEQTSQLFVATHSEYILQYALENENIAIINIDEDHKRVKTFFKGDGGEILPTITLGELKWRIFDLETVDFHIELYGYIQNNKIENEAGEKISNHSIKATDKYLCKMGEKTPFMLKTWVYNSSKYNSLSTYIRNCIDHPSGISSTQRKFTNEELRKSIEFMICIIRPTN